MPIRYDPTILTDFFGTPGEVSEADTIGRILWIEYTGPILKYSIHLDLDAEAVAISGDTTRPFGSDSMYEIYMPCSHIVSGPDGYHEGGIALAFCYGGTDINLHRRLMILKRPDGELKVWPAFLFPDSHQYGVKPESPAISPH